MTADARVCVNGVQVSNPAARVRQSDRVTVDGELTPLEVAPPRLWRFHKPLGLITTASDPQGRPTVFASLPGWLPRVLSVGRLDLRSEGLLLLTNSGPLARMLELPSNAFERKYRALVCTGQERGVTGAMLRAMGDGLTLRDQTRFRPIRAVRTPLQPAAAGHEWVRMTLVEGKTREVRRAWQHFGFVVSRLVRDAYGPFELGELRPGEVEEVPRRCVARLLRLRERVLEGSGRAAPVDLAAFCENEQT